MAHPQLKRSPIVEAVCEFRFAADAPWDWTVPGLLAPALEPDYPVRREVVGHVITFGPTPTQEVAPPPERFQFVSRDELSMVQTGPRMLAINRLSPYPGWADFSAQILGALDLHTERRGWMSIDRVGLLYINRIESEEPPEDVLAVAPRTEPLPEEARLTSFAQRWELSFNDSSLTLTTTRVAVPAGYAIQLDASTTSIAHVGDRSRLVQWLENAHEMVYQVFMRSLTSAAFERLND